MEGPLSTYCSTAPSPHDGSSNAGRSPDKQDSTPSIRSESPRQTKYALRNIELQARESRQLPTYHQGLDYQGVRASGAVPGDGWSNSVNPEAPTGFNPIVNNNININGFDVDMTDNANASHSNSAGLTPQSSATYRSASHTSYSSPRMSDEGAINAGKNPRPNAFTPPNDELFPSPNMMNAKSPNSFNGTMQEDAFKMASSWNMNGGQTPNFSGMTPDGSWDKMMQDAGMIWDDQQKPGMTPR